MGKNLENRLIKTMKPIFEKVIKWGSSREEDRDMVSKARDMCQEDLESGKCNVSSYG